MNQPAPAADTPGCWAIGGVFGLLMLPLYLLFRYAVKLVRQAYGFDQPSEEEARPLRVCYSCNNTVMEDDFTHCPYCGTALPDAPADVDET
ncbi:MAG: hypothetical protein ACK2UL_10165 [Anaerolineae bacterium]